tara:strand:+ start:22109 stop:22870 length:762 start_codon:yes stop_codon:yes gene_type:complete
MLMQQTIEHLKRLKLIAMIESYSRQLSDPNQVSLSFDERFGMLVDAQVNDLEQRRVNRGLKTAKLKSRDACVADIDYRTKRQLEKAIMMSLISCDWINRGQHVIFSGPTGVGKSWLACALCHQAIICGYSALYFRFNRLLEDIEVAKRDGSIPKLRTKLLRAQVLLIDDWAVSPITAKNRQDLLDLIEDRSGNGSLIITSQLPVSKWHDYLGEVTIADAILDRIVHQSHFIELDGDSMRKKQAAKQRRSHGDS